MYAQVKYAALGGYNRVIAVSDMHAHPEVFSAVLERIGFCGQDALVLLGDFVNRGDQSLEMLHQVMALSRQDNVYVSIGNNDDRLLDWMDSLANNQNILEGLRTGWPTIHLEMAKALSLPYETVEDVERIRLAIREHYSEEITFLRNLPHIIDSDIATFVHAGLQPGDLQKQDKQFCLTVSSFDKQTHRFDKPLIVGHWPACNYRKRIIDANVHVNPQTNVISMDGGLGVNHFGQLNYCIIHPATGKIEWGYCDNHPKISALDDQAESEDYLTVNFPDTKLVVEKQTDKEAQCYLPAADRRITFPLQKIYCYKGEYHCFNFTTYCLPVTAGETLSLCQVLDNGILAAKGGMVGIYHGRYQRIQEENI